MRMPAVAVNGRPPDPVCGTGKKDGFSEAAHCFLSETVV